jgi:hypothetical protein
MSNSYIQDIYYPIGKKKNQQIINKEDLIMTPYCNSLNFQILLQNKIQELNRTKSVSLKTMINSKNGKNTMNIIDKFQANKDNEKIPMMILNEDNSLKEIKMENNISDSRIQNNKPNKNNERNSHFNDDLNNCMKFNFSKSTVDIEHNISHSHNNTPFSKYHTPLAFKSINESNIVNLSNVKPEEKSRQYNIILPVVEDSKDAFMNTNSEYKINSKRNKEDNKSAIQKNTQKLATQNIQFKFIKNKKPYISCTNKLYSSREEKKLYIQDILSNNFNTNSMPRPMSNIIRRV